MTDSSDAAHDRAFEDHDAYLTSETDATRPRYTLQTTAFDGEVFLPQADAAEPTYEVVVRTPTLEAATSEQVGPAVAVGWFETFKKRLGDAPGATRHDVSLDAFGVAEDDDTVVVRYEFVEANPQIAADVAKTFVEYVEGTYVEGVVPGYQYEGAVAELIGEAAAHGSEGNVGGTPL